MYLMSGIYEILTRNFDFGFRPKYNYKIKRYALSGKNFKIRILYEPFISMVEFLLYLSKRMFFQYVA